MPDHEAAERYRRTLDGEPLCDVYPHNEWSHLYDLPFEARDDDRDQLARAYAAELDRRPNQGPSPRPARGTEGRRTMTERLPQRFRYRVPQNDRWFFGVVTPHEMHDFWSVRTFGNGFTTFENEPGETILDLIGDVDSFQWIDNDYGWAGDVMERPDPLDELDNYKSPPFPSAGTRKAKCKESK